MPDLRTAAERVTRFHTCTLDCNNIPLHRAIEELRAALPSGTRPQSTAPIAAGDATD